MHFKCKGLLKKSNCVLEALILFTEASGRGVQNNSPEPSNKKATVLLEKERLAISFGVSVQILFRRADIKKPPQTARPRELALLMTVACICTSFMLIWREIKPDRPVKFLWSSAGQLEGKASRTQRPRLLSLPCFGSCSVQASEHTDHNSHSHSTELADGTKPAILKSLWRLHQKSWHSIGILTQVDQSKILAYSSSLDTNTD